MWVQGMIRHRVRIMRMSRVRVRFGQVSRSALVRMMVNKRVHQSDAECRIKVMGMLCLSAATVLVAAGW